MSLGERVREIRTSHGLSQTDLARLAGMQQPAISAIESGRSMTTRTVERLADALGVPMSTLFEQESPPLIPLPPKPRLASSRPEQLESRIYGAPAAEIEGKLQPVLSEPEARRLSDDARRELDALEDWLTAYAAAPSEERFERRGDYERARELRDRARFYHDLLFDFWSKLYDPRPVPFKSARQFATETVEARTSFLSALENEDERRRVEQRGEAG